MIDRDFCGAVPLCSVSRVPTGVHEWCIHLGRGSTRTAQVLANGIITVLDYMVTNDRWEFHPQPVRFESVLRRNMKLLGSDVSPHKARPFGRNSMELIPPSKVQLWAPIIVTWFLTGLRFSSFCKIVKRDVFFDDDDQCWCIKVGRLKTQKKVFGPGKIQTVRVYCNCVKPNEQFPVDKYCPIHGFDLPHFPVPEKLLLEICTALSITKHSPRRALAMALRWLSENVEGMDAFLTGEVVNKIFLWAQASGQIRDYTIDFDDWQYLDWIPMMGALKRGTAPFCDDGDEGEEDDRVDDIIRKVRADEVGRTGPDMDDCRLVGHGRAGRWGGGAFKHFH